MTRIAPAAATLQEIHRWVLRFTDEEGLLVWATFRFGQVRVHGFTTRGRTAYGRGEPVLDLGTRTGFNVEFV